MPDRYRLTSIETVEDAGSWRCTVLDRHGDPAEVVLVPCEDGEERVEAWYNRCTHEAQRLHREGVGAVFRDGEIVCPKHGSTFDACSGHCDNGPAADSTLPAVEIAVEDGQVYLVDEDVDYLHDGSVDEDDGDDGPDSTSHLRF